MLMSTVTAVTGIMSLCYSQVNTGLNPYLETRFLKDSLPINENAFYFNSLSLRNTSGKQLNLTVVIESPCFINLVSENNQKITLNPEESFALPLRFSGNSRNSCATGWEKVVVKMVDPSSNFLQDVSFAVKPGLKLKWKVQLLEPVVIVTDQTSKLIFNIKIENNGNIADKYKISFTNEFSALNYKTLISLAPGESVVEKIDLKLKDVELKALQNKDITVFFENLTGEKKVLIQKFARIESVFHDNMDAWYRVPITAELNTVGLLKNDTYHFLRIYGNQVFSRERTLSFNVQSPSLYMNGNTEPGASPSFEYTTKKFTVSAGLLYESNQFIVFGNGLKVRYKKGVNDWYEAGYNKSSFADIDQGILRMGREISKSVLYTGNTILNLDHDVHNNAIASVHRFDWSQKKFSLSAETGFGFQRVKNNIVDTSLKGPMVGISGVKSEGNLTGTFNLHLYSKSFPGVYKGYSHYVHEIKWAFGKYSMGSFIELGNQQPFIFIDTSFEDKFSYLLKNISLRLGYAGKNLNIIMYPGLLTQKQDSLDSPQSEMKKLTTTLYYTLFSKWQVSLTNNIGTITLPSVKTAGKIFSMYNSFSVQSKHVGMFIRYDVGPYYYRDILEYVDKGTYKTIFQAAPFLNYLFPRINLDTRMQLNIIHNNPSEDNGMQLLNNFLWQVPEKKFALGVNTNLDMKNTRNSFINLVARQQLNVPVIKKRSYKNFKIILFKDADGDGARSDSELLVSNAQLMLEGRLLQTNQNGEIDIVNYAGNALHLDLSPINNLIGWVPSRGLKQDWPITGSKIIYIPFKRARLITGKLVLDKDEKSTASFDVAGIRITAVGRDGTSYSTLTGGDGTFYLNVVDDEYVVSINQNVFDETFKIIDPVRNVDLVNNRRVDINFVVKQKRREIIIKKE
jgi:hypothetical protein